MYKRRIAPSGSTSAAKLLLTVDEAAQALSVGRTLVYDLLMCGEIPSIKIGAARRVPVGALEEYIRRLSAQEHR
jgi:excisionase family DNA binding protein